MRGLARHDEGGQGTCSQTKDPWSSLVCAHRRRHAGICWTRSGKWRALRIRWRQFRLGRPLRRQLRLWRLRHRLFGPREIWFSAAPFIHWFPQINLRSEHIRLFGQHNPYIAVFSYSRSQTAIYAERAVALRDLWDSLRARSR